MNDTCLKISWFILSVATGLGTSPRPWSRFWPRPRLWSWLRFGSRWFFFPWFLFISWARLIMCFGICFRGASSFGVRCRPRTWFSLHFFLGLGLGPWSWIGFRSWKRSISVFESIIVGMASATPWSSSRSTAKKYTRKSKEWQMSIYSLLKFLI